MSDNIKQGKMNLNMNEWSSTGDTARRMQLAFSMPATIEQWKRALSYNEVLSTIVNSVSLMLIFH
ncbi:hypothetical protein BLOT_012777 [Blomia tropicalis]|nr:hypothetical protein BLOT_012777 [Blomia tropicalis]